MKILVFVCVFILTKSLFAGADFYLAVGELRKTDIPVNGSIHLAQSRAIKIETQGGRVFLIGRQPGEARFTMGNQGRNWSVVVYPAKMQPVLDQIRTWLRDHPELSVSVRPQALFIEGTIHRLPDWLKLQELKSRYKPYVELSVAKSTLLQDAILKGLKKDLMTHSLTSARALIEGTSVILDISGSEKAQQRKAEQIANHWGVEVRWDSNLIELRPMVEVELTLVEVKKSMARSLGIKLPGSFSATVLPSADLTSFLTQFSPLTVQASAEQGEGSGKIIANPKLLCRSGESAQFLAGGEIPIKVARWKSGEVVWKKYGVILNISPKADYSGAISTKIVTEISLLDESKKIDGVPGLLTNRIETHFDLRGQKSIALSGLIKSELARYSSGTPLLNSIPILGALFSSRDFVDKKSELVVFVTPRMVNPDPEPDESRYDFIWEDNP